MLNPIKIPLIKRLYKSYYPAARAKKNELIITASDKGEIVALLRLKTIDESRLLTGMLVIPKVRGAGVGELLLNYCEKNIFTNGDYCFAFSHLESYYSRHGFKTIDHLALPSSLNQAFQRYVDGGKDLIPMQFLPSTAAKYALL